MTKAIAPIYEIFTVIAYKVEAPCSSDSIFSKFILSLADLIAAVFSLVTPLIISSRLFASSGFEKSNPPNEQEILNQHARARMEACDVISVLWKYQA